MLFVIAPLWLLALLAGYGLLLAVRTMQPRVNSSAEWVPHDPNVRNDPSDSGAWVVSIGNYGRAPVNLLDVAYTLEFRDPVAPRLDGVTAVKVLAALEAAGVVDRDYYLLNVTPGKWLAANTELRLSALPMPLARRIAVFTATYAWRSDGGFTAPPKTVHFVQPFDNPLRPPLPPPHDTRGEKATTG